MNFFGRLNLKNPAFWRTFLGFILAGVFFVAGVAKLADLAAFSIDIRQFRMLPESWSIYLAATVPWLEIFAAIAFFCRPFRLTSSFLMLVMMTIFTLAVMIALVRGLDISCGCFGKAFAEYAGSGVGFLLRDVALLTLSAILLMLVWRQEQNDRFVKSSYSA